MKRRVRKRYKVYLSFLTWHADASELAPAVDAGSQILTGVRVALIDIHLASWSSVALQRENFH